mmetsp:Transcript_70967/g.140896  ORF Transcript_70967/g.140896 Transcript_70967/m.140896 type:complete len:81 (+) Transcript_70967:847-1089(+)
MRSVRKATNAHNGIGDMRKFLRMHGEDEMLLEASVSRFAAARQNGSGPTRKQPSSPMEYVFTPQAATPVICPLAANVGAA